MTMQRLFILVVSGVLAAPVVAATEDPRLTVADQQAKDTARIRQTALPLLQTDDKSIASDAWVTRTVQIRNVQASGLVPILRPLLPKAGHLAAHKESNTLIMVDRYDNTKRLIALIKILDQHAKQRE